MLVEETASLLLEEAKGSTSSGSANGFAKRPHHRCLKTASPLPKGLVGETSRPWTGPSTSARSSRHRPWTRPSTSARSSDVCALNEWLSGGPGCRRRVRHGALVSLSQNGYGLGPYCMSVQCGRVGNPPANHRKATKDFENQEKFRDPGLVRFGSASPIDGGSIGPENLTLTKGPPLPSSGRFRQSLSDQKISRCDRVPGPTRVYTPGRNRYTGVRPCVLRGQVMYPCGAASFEAWSICRVP